MYMYSTAGIGHNNLGNYLTQKPEEYMYLWPRESGCGSCTEHKNVHVQYVLVKALCEYTVGIIEHR